MLGACTISNYKHKVLGSHKEFALIQHVHQVSMVKLIRYKNLCKVVVFMWYRLGPLMHQS